MLRILRAFAWLRWRILLNTLERSTSRDLVERFSLGIEQLSPFLLAIVMLPSAIGLAAAGALAGWSLAHGQGGGIPFATVRAVLFGALVLSALGPLLLRAGSALPPVRLLLLPIPRVVLYAAQSVGSLADPWVLLAAAVITGVAAGLAAGGALMAAAIAVAAGLLLIAAFVGIAALASAVLQLAVRSRRRAEILALAGMLLLAGIGLVPGLLEGTRNRPAAARVETGEAGPGDRLKNATAALRPLLPSAQYAAAVSAAAPRAGTAAIRSLATLATTCAAAHLGAFVLFGCVWRSAGVSAGLTRVRGAFRAPRLPGLSNAASAVAHNQIRLALRTPRGRSIMLSPLVIVAVFAVILLRNPSGLQFAFVTIGGGISLAVAGAFVSLLAILPLAVNQFAIDRAGLTFLLMAPVETGALLAGKAAGNAAVAAIPAGMCMTAALVLFPSGHPALWLSVPLGFAGTYLLVAPAAAALSALFPRTVDLSSVGSGSNAHGTATVLGMLATALAAMPCAGLVLLAVRILGRPLLAALFLLVWCVLCALLSVGLLRAVRPLFDRRRENLALTSQS